jgi:hypothetical protein
MLLQTNFQGWLDINGFITNFTLHTHTQISFTVVFTVTNDAVHGARSVAIFWR